MAREQRDHSDHDDNGDHGDDSEPAGSVVQWLLESDPSLRWQVLRDVLGAPAAEVAAERARVAPDGRWLLDTRFPGVMPIELDEGEARPSRWNTLRALRVAKWHASGG